MNDAYILAYVSRVLGSCTSQEQLACAEKWASDVLMRYGVRSEFGLLVVNKSVIWV